MAPHIAEEMWELAGFTESVFKSEWPEFDPAAIVGDMIEIAVQINGKLRASVSVPVGSDQATAETAAFADLKVQSYTLGKTVVKKVYVPGRLLNIVVRT